jgi:hypothetical protein
MKNEETCKGLQNTVLVHPVHGSRWNCEDIEEKSETKMVRKANHVTHQGI